jgi:superfamily II DNA helicase RecQ
MNYILSYFGEQSKVVCGMCDLCRAVPLPNQDQSLELRTTILRHLQIKPLNSRTLADNIEAPEAWILGAITELLQEELIEINRDHDYSIKK